MVCLGNICRSPLAQGILESKIKQYQLKNITVDSAGTGNWHSGSAPDTRSINIAKKLFLFMVTLFVFSRFSLISIF